MFTFDMLLHNLVAVEISWLLMWSPLWDYSCGQRYVHMYISFIWLELTGTMVARFFTT